MRKPIPVLTGAALVALVAGGALPLSAQAVPEQRDAGGAERVVALTDRVWFKVKTSDHRAAVTELRGTDQSSRGRVPHVRLCFPASAGDDQQPPKPRVIVPLQRLRHGRERSSCP